MKRYLLVMTIVAALLQANEEMVIDSGFAEYDGKRITLSKDVVVEHEIGKISAEKMVLIPAEDEKKKLQFSFLEMQDAVKISMKEGGMLGCSRAELDYLKLLGKFYGDVIYSEDCRGKGDVKIPLSVRAQQMVLRLERENEKTKINRIEASSETTIHYNQDFIASADEAVYQRLPAEDVNDLNIPGEIILRKSLDNGICRITNSQGDLVDASQIRIDTVKRILYCTHPSGVFLEVLANL